MNIGGAVVKVVTGADLSDECFGQHAVALDLADPLTGIIGFNQITKESPV